MRARMFFGFALAVALSGATVAAPPASAQPASGNYGYNSVGPGYGRGSAGIYNNAPPWMMGPGYGYGPGGMMEGYGPGYNGGPGPWMRGPGYGGPGGMMGGYGPGYGGAGPGP